MSAPTLTTPPAAVRAGDSASWLLTLADYPASSGWSVQYDLLNAGGKISFTSTAEGDLHRITRTPAQTATWVSGTYQWQARVSNGTDAYTVAVGSIEILPDLAVAVGLDTRTHAQKTLAALEAWIENHDPGVAEYEIAGRRMKYIALADLIKLRSQYLIEVRREGGKPARPGRILMRS